VDRVRQGLGKESQADGNEGNKREKDATEFKVSLPDLPILKRGLRTALALAESQR
jgi:hypothetical protein